MEYREWEPIYERILEDFNFSREEDERAARLLSRLVKGPVSLDKLEQLIRGNDVNVFGAGPSLEDLDKIPGGTSIVADGVTSFFLQRGQIPQIIVTDLDGDVEDIIRANKKGSIVVVHGHGHNMDKLDKYVPLLKDPIATTQSKPLGHVYNFGGFTDGDRAVLLARHFGARIINLIAMDFDSRVGRYSFSGDTELKRKKLKWAKRILKETNLLR